MKYLIIKKVDEKMNEVLIQENEKIGNLIYETEDESIATVDQTGKIVAKGKGQTKVKITDEENGNSTYIIINVTEDGQKRGQITAGKDYVVALKENGTVWTWGTNEKGQNNEPIQVKTENGEDLKNIKQIEAGEKIAIALDEEGNVYTWGVNTGENNNVNEGNVSRIPQKIEVITNIEKINSYKDKFYAIDTPTVKNRKELYPLFVYIKIDFVASP